MVFTTPNCPDCGSRYLVTALRTPARHYDVERRYRCWRCLTPFGEGDVPEGAGGVGGDGDAGRGREAGGTGEGDRVGKGERVGEADGDAVGEIAAVRLDLEPEGTKWRVERFDVVVRNGGEDPLRVDRVFLTFDGKERTSVPREDVVVDPGDTGTVAIHRSWIHADQDLATVELRSGSALVATADVDLSAHRADGSTEGSPE